MPRPMSTTTLRTRAAMRARTPAAIWAACPTRRRRKAACRRLIACPRGACGTVFRFPAHRAKMPRRRTLRRGPRMQGPATHRTTPRSSFPAATQTRTLAVRSPTAPAAADRMPPFTSIASRADRSARWPTGPMSPNQTGRSAARVDAKSGTTTMRTMDLPAPVLAPYTGAQLRFATAAWPMRAGEELRSARIFRALSHASRTVGLPDPWPIRFASAVRDEVHHARLCATVAAILAAPEPTYDARPVRARLASVPEPLARLLSLLLVEVAMGETISMYLFRAGRRASIEPLTRAALGLIVGDEVRHQRLGWMGLAFLWPTLNEPTRAALQREAARGLALQREAARGPALGG